MLSLAFITLIGVQVGAGVWLFLRGLRGGPKFPSCGGCGYDLSGSLGSVARCPECGSAFTRVGINKPGPRRRPVLMLAGAALVGVAIGCIGTGLTTMLLMTQRATTARARAIAARAQAVAARTDAPPATTAPEAAADDQGEE